MQLNFVNSQAIQNEWMALSAQCIFFDDFSLSLPLSLCGSILCAHSRNIWNAQYFFVIHTLLLLISVLLLSSCCRRPLFVPFSVRCRHCEWANRPYAFDRRIEAADSIRIKVCTRATVYCRNYDIHRIIFSLSRSLHSIIHSCDILLRVCVVFLFLLWISSDSLDCGRFERYYSGFLLSLCRFCCLFIVKFSTFFVTQKTKSKCPIIEKWTHLSSVHGFFSSIPLLFSLLSSVFGKKNFSLYCCLMLTRSIIKWNKYMGFHKMGIRMKTDNDYELPFVCSTRGTVCAAHTAHASLLSNPWHE